MTPTGKACEVPARKRYLTPGEFSLALADSGLSMHPDTVRRRCGLPAGDPLRIATHPDFPGRHYIPVSEFDRISSGTAEASA